MGARTGKEYIERLRASRRTVQLDGETLSSGIPDHPAFRGVVRSYAELYDMQHETELRDVLTYESPSSGDRVGMSFMVPRTIDDLLRRREAMKAWADHSFGMLGRTGDYLNSALMALSQAGPWFAQADPGFAENVPRSRFSRPTPRNPMTRLAKSATRTLVMSVAARSFPLRKLRFGSP